MENGSEIKIQEEPLFVRLFKLAVLILALLAIFLVVYISVVVIKGTVHFLDIYYLYLAIVR